jgi:predicted RNase H-like HicB family nuclease
MKSYIFKVEMEQEEDGRWSSWIEELPGCATWGYSREEALDALKEAAQAYLGIWAEKGQPIPITDTVQTHDYLRLVGVLNSSTACFWLRQVCHDKGGGGIGGGIAFMQVGACYRDDPAFDVARLAAELVEAESVPLLPVLCYKASGLRQRAAWEQTWDMQRHEDAIDARTRLSQDDPQYLTEVQAHDLKRCEIGTIPVPPRYTSSDFASSTSWRLRGKLDVPKERWISFPHCEGADGMQVIAWAGYDHLQLARAISAYYVDIQERLGGHDDPRLEPLLAGLIALLPWLKQWHNDVDPEFGLHMGDYFEGFIQEEARQMGKTRDQIMAWKPPKTAARRHQQAARSS